VLSALLAESVEVARNHYPANGCDAGRVPWAWFGSPQLWVPKEKPRRAPCIGWAKFRRPRQSGGCLRFSMNFVCCQTSTL
jgi:hypothetical protein